jgi:hypothetical protein
MFSSVILTLLPLVPVASAGILDLNVQAGFCNVYEKNAFLNVSQTVGAKSPKSCNLEPSIQSPIKKPKTQKLTTKWTHKPECVVEEESKEEFCVYTNSDFANGRGISFFTTPSIAAKVRKLPAFTKPGVHDHANDFSDPPWEVRNIPGRGNGLFATRELKRGDFILADTPMGVWNSDAFFADYGLGYKYLRKSFENLPEESKRIFLRTAAHNPGDPIMERINTNAFAGEFEGASHFFLYPETAVSFLIRF